MNFDDVPSRARVAASDALTEKSVTDGIFNAGLTTFMNVTGDACEAIIIYKHTGTDSTAALIAYRDNSGAFTVTPDGGNIGIQWNAAGVFTI